jgi:hypothetical protein
MDTLERDFVPNYADTFDLPQAAIDEATLLSQNIKDPLSAWQVYLAHLGLTGLTAWIETTIDEAGLALQFDRSQARLLPPTASDLPAAVTQIKLGEFKLCMIAITDSDEIVEIPQMAIEHPDQAGHFYVTVSVNTEAEVVGIKGFIRYDQIQERNLSVSSNGVYEIAIEQFEPQLDRLFFLATGLNPGAIVLPQAAPKLAPAPIRQMLIRPIMNAAAWGKQQLEASLEALDDFLALGDNTNPQLVPAFRGGTSSIQAANPLQEIRSELTRQGCVIPVNVQASYEDSIINGMTIRVAMAKWQIPQENLTDVAEWSLLVIAKPLGVLTEPVQIVIEHRETAMNRIELNDSDRYMQAIGELDELFTIAICYGQTELVFPPVSFHF